MVRSELVRILSGKLPELEHRDVELAVNCMLEQMITSFVNDERVEVRGFGAFELHHQSSRIARNPKTGEVVSIPEKVRVHFKPGKELRDRVNAARGKCRIIDV